MVLYKLSFHLLHYIDFVAYRELCFAMVDANWWCLFDVGIVDYWMKAENECAVTWNTNVPLLEVVFQSICCVMELPSAMTRQMSEIAHKVTGTASPWWLNYMNSELPVAYFKVHYLQKINKCSCVSSLLSLFIVNIAAVYCCYFHCKILLLYCIPSRYPPRCIPHQIPSKWYYSQFKGECA